MYEKLLNETEKYLEHHKNKEIAFIDIWQEMAEQSEKLHFDMPDSIGDFEMLLEGDKRFIFIKPKADVIDVDLGEEEGEYEVGEDFFEVEEIEKLGFNERQIIALRKYVSESVDEDDKETVFAPHNSTGTTHHKTSNGNKTGKKSKTPAAKKKSSTKRKK